MSYPLDARYLASARIPAWMPARLPRHPSMEPEKLNQHRLTVYSSTTCPDCLRLKALFGARGVTYEEVLIDEDPQAAERLEAETGKRGVPYILVDEGTWVRGYHLDQPGRLREALLWEELERALDT